MATATKNADTDQQQILPHTDDGDNILSLSNLKCEYIELGSLDKNEENLAKTL